MEKISRTKHNNKLRSAGNDWRRKSPDTDSKKETKENGTKKETKNMERTEAVIFTRIFTSFHLTH